MNKTESITKLTDIKNRLKSFNAVIDDGRDYEDARQNTSYNQSKKDLDRIIRELVSISPDGISKETVDKIWNDAWGNATDVHLPEVRMNHAIKYVVALSELLNEQQ